MFHKGKTYVHRNMLDCCFKVLYAFKNKSVYKLDIDWYYQSGMRLGIQDIVFVDENQLDKWKEFEVKNDR